MVRGSHPNELTENSPQDNDAHRSEIPSDTTDHSKPTVHWQNVDDQRSEIPSDTANAREIMMMRGYNLYAKVAVTQAPEIASKVVGHLLGLGETQLLTL
jgi:hypothetical protein